MFTMTFPLDETQFVVVRGLIQQEVHSSASTRRVQLSVVAKPSGQNISTVMSRPELILIKQNLEGFF